MHRRRSWLPLRYFCHRELTKASLAFKAIPRIVLSPAHISAERPSQVVAWSESEIL